MICCFNWKSGNVMFSRSFMLALFVCLFLCFLCSQYFKWLIDKDSPGPALGHGHFLTGHSTFEEDDATISKSVLCYPFDFNIFFLRRSSHDQLGSSMCTSTPQTSFVLSVESFRSELRLGTGPALPFLTASLSLSMSLREHLPDPWMALNTLRSRG